MPAGEPTGEVALIREDRPSPSPEPRRFWPPLPWLSPSEVPAAEVALVVAAEASMSKRARGGSLLYPRLRGGHTEMPRAG